MVAAWCISCQFFTVMPIKRTITVTKLRMKIALHLLPLIGLFLGCIVATLLFFTISLPVPMTAFLIITVAVVITGGIHLDGWIDTADAFFSYREKAKRLEIMADPRIGAFAVMSLLFLLGWRYLFIFETIQALSIVSLISIALIYYYNRLAMLYVLMNTPLAKQEGLAATFQVNLKRRETYVHYVTSLLLLIMIAMIDVRALFVTSVLFVMTVTVAHISKLLIVKHFGGVTGDTVGAVGEGVETVLWGALWLLHSFVMGKL